MRATWGYDQKILPREPCVSAPGMRVSQVPTDPEARDPTIPDASSMSEQQLETELRKLKKYAEEKELNMTHTFQGSAGKANGIISKPRFKTAIGMLFHHYPLSEELIAAIAYKYGTGPEDPHGGGYMEVMWRAFVIELRQFPDPTPAEAPNPFDERICKCLRELRQIAEDTGLDMTHTLQGAGGRSTGVISKQKFFMAITSLLFPHYHFSDEMLQNIALIYANTKGPPDLRLGGYQECLWRQFVIDVRKVPLPSHYLPDM